MIWRLEARKTTTSDETRSLANRKPPRPTHHPSPHCNAGQAIYDVRCTAYRDPEPCPGSKHTCTAEANAGQRARMLPIGSRHPCFPGAKHVEGKRIQRASWLCTCCRRRGTTTTTIQRRTQKKARTRWRGRWEIPKRCRCICMLACDRRPNMK